MAERPVQKPPLDRYVVLDYLAEGGMGAIYLGKKLGAGGFEKEVVLKQLLPEFTAQPEFIDLFLREARLSATLDHANIVHTIDLVNAGDEYFIVMEYVRGGDLRTLLKRAKRRKKRIQPAAGVFIARDMLSALAYAHQKIGMDGRPLQLIHRDVSPSNILVSGTGEVKLTDFGIAKASTHRSIFYRVKGKVGYMSPEQAKNETLDPRSDLYSLAVCLYELLTGERLFVNAGLTTSAEEMYKQPVPAVSRKRPGLPKDLDKVMFKALAVDRDERYQTAGEFQEALLRVAHRNNLIITATELAEHMSEACGKVKEWSTSTISETPGQGTEAYSFGGDPGTDKLRLADIGVESVDGASQAGGGRTGTALLPPGEDDDDSDVYDDLDDYLEEDGASDVDGEWARDAGAQVGGRPAAVAPPRPSGKRRQTSEGSANRLAGLELTSLIQMDQLTHAGAKPLVALDDSVDRPVATPEPPPPREVSLRGQPQQPKDPVLPPPQASRERREPGKERREDRPKPAPRPSAQRPASGTGEAKMPTARTSAVERTDKPERTAEDPWARRMPAWLPIVGLALLGVIIAYAIAVSGPDLKPTTKKPGIGGPTPEPPPAVKSKLTMESVPSGARVQVDGRERCKTPCTIDDLSSSSAVLVQLDKDGFMPWTGLWQPGAVARRSARLRPRPAGSDSVGTVVLRGDVPAEVLVGGEEIGHVTTAGPLQLPPGPVELTLVSASGARTTVSLTIVAGKTIERTVKLK